MEFEVCDLLVLVLFLTFSGMAGASHWTYLEGSVKEFPLWNGKRVIILG